VESTSTALETATLDTWINQRGQIDDVLATFLADPRLPEATRVFAMNMQELARADAALDAIFKDIGRYIVTMCTLYLHFRGGATLPRLKAMLAIRFYVSPGRARALLHFLCHLGFVTELPPPTRRDPVRYMPTDRFMTAWRSHISVALEATRIVEPSVAPVLGRLHEPDVFAAFCRHHTEYGFGEIREGHKELAFTRVFLHRFAGTQILWHLLSAQGAEEAPLMGAIPVSVSDIMERHRVSRMHVKRLLDAGVREGFLRYGNNHGVVLEDVGRATARFVHATQFFVFTVAADKTTRELSLQ
jgi:hypothetical protein